MFSFVKVVKKKKNGVMGKTILLILHLIAGTFIHVCQKNILFNKQVILSNY